MRIPQLKTGIARRASESLYPNLWRGLDASWAPCMGVTGATLEDYSGHHNESTLTGMDMATDWQPGRCGYQVDFVGDGQYGTLSKDIGSDRGTVIAWVKPAMGYASGSPFTHAIIGSGSSSVRNELYYDSATGNRRFVAVLRFNFGLTATINGRQFSSDAELQVWHCVAYTWDAIANSHAIYLNGELDATDTTDIEPWGGDTGWRIADSVVAGASWTGGIASIQKYNRVLSAPELKMAARYPALLHMRKQPSIGLVPVAGSANIPAFRNHYVNQGIA